MTTFSAVGYSRLELANYANLTLYVAMVVLTVTMLAFAIHLAFTVPRRDAAGAVTGHGTDAVLAGHGTDEATATAGDTDDAQAQKVAPRELAASGVGALGTGRAVRVGGPDVQEQGTQDPGAGDPGSPASGLSAGSGDAPGAQATRARRGEALGSVGMSLSWLAAMLLLASVVLRGVSVSRVPVANMFEFAVFGALLVMAVYLGLAMRWPIRWLGLFVVVPVLLVLGLALSVWYSPAAELLPSLQSLWLSIHVPIATLAVAVFTVAFSVLLVHLAKDRRETSLAQAAAEGEPSPARGPWAVLDSLPSARALDSLAYGLHVVAFPLWTFSLIAGAIWAQRAWGSYWNWDPKEVWTFVIWVIYAAYLHARATSGWSRRTANILAVLGYVAIIVNFAVVNVYFVGQHSYSGL